MYKNKNGHWTWPLDGDKNADREMALAKENLCSNRDFKLSQNYYLTVFSGLFSECFVTVKREHYSTI